MASISSPIAVFDPTIAPPEPVKRWTVAEYHELIRLGILKEGDPYELIEGWLVTKKTKNPPHDSTIDQLHEMITAILPKPWRCRIQSAITLDDGEPEPDLVIVRGPASRYRERHPGATDVAVVVEVSESTLPRDRGMKSRSYARATIAQYWIVNLVSAQIEVYSAPNASAAAYQKSEMFGSGTSVPLVIEGAQVGEISVADLWR